MIKKLYQYRFEIFLLIQTAILFGSLLFPADLFEYKLLPMLFLLSIGAGILMISRRRKLMWFFIVLFVVTSTVFGFDMFSKTQNTENILIRLSIYFVFYLIVSWNIILQVWQAKRVTKNVIFGLMSGYISLGFLAFFLFLTIEILNPGSFTGELIANKPFEVIAESLMYYAYITMITIGYGEIVPATSIAQKAAVLVGLIGQFYLVIITAIVVGKFISQERK